MIRVPNRDLRGPEPSTPSPEELAIVPDRQAHPSRQPIAEMMVIGTSSRDRPENHGFIVVGSVPAGRESLSELDSSTGWPGVVAYLDRRDRDMDSADY